MINQVEHIAQDIRTMKTRGAGKIGRAAAAALKIAAKTSKAKTSSEFIKEIDRVASLLIATRPTAVSLPNAVKFVVSKLAPMKGADIATLRKIVVSRADEFIHTSNNAVKVIGEIGARRISNGDVLMTHCNSQCALAVIKTAFRQGKRIKAFVTESRPSRQGFVTARELSKAGVPTTMIVDSAVRYFIRDVNKVIVGADSIAANGAVINKIGTSQIALVAHEARVPFFVAAESYKFHPGTLVGSLVEIEERDPGEIVNPKRFPRVKIRNPVFDVTPPEFIDLIITERGIVPPQAAYTLLQAHFEWKPGEELV
ncbi:MAG: ribose 1,5-bisphosphate isomerase [Hadesarchaea archaeon CG08_land_8_20_14_0_20_51_8]|nr:MAG: ribose 1,5-bisphosphate isomerase [Hadesarchaea archaeon CG08_land_8_20_14_0_20_51_8]